MFAIRYMQSVNKFSKFLAKFAGLLLTRRETDKSKSDRKDENGDASMLSSQWKYSYSFVGHCTAINNSDAVYASLCPMMSCCVYTLADEGSHVGCVKKFLLSIFAIHPDCEALLHREQSHSTESFV